MATKAERNPIRNRGLIMIPYKGKEEWRGIRKGYIGGSDAAAIVGMNPHKSPYSVWAEKTGQQPEFSGNISTRAGEYLEDFVAKLYMEASGKSVQRLKFTLVNPEYPWACANIDREVNNEDALLEIKTTTSLGIIKKFRQGEYPAQWYGQMVHYLAVTGAKKAYLAALENNRELHTFELERDEVEIRTLMEAEKAYWERYVVGGVMPPTDGSDATTETIREMWGESVEETVELYGVENICREIKRIDEQANALKEQKAALSNSLKTQLREAEKGTCGKWVISWKTQKTSGLDRAAMQRDFPGLDFSKYATKARVFRISERKTG